jgi:hypothetical protein
MTFVLPSVHLADTPPTIIPLLAFWLFAMASPVIALWVAILIIRPATRRFGLRILAVAVAGSLLTIGGCALVTLDVADTSGVPPWITWTVTAAGGFGSFAALALVFGYYFRYRKV